MATKVNISLKPENAVKGVNIGFPYIVDNKNNSKKREFIVGNFDGVGLKKESKLSLCIEFGRYEKRSFGRSIYVNASKFTKGLSECGDPAQEFVMSTVGSKYVEKCNSQEYGSPSYFFDENLDVHMRMDLFRIFTTISFDVVDIIDRLICDYEEYITGIDHKDCPF